MKPQRFRRRLAAFATAAAAFGGTLAGALALTTLPASAGSNGPTSYELDCTGTGAAAGSIAPYAVTTNLNGSPDPAGYAQGTTFGASGSLSLRVSGAQIAGTESGLGNASIPFSSLDVGTSGLNIGSADGTATGNYSYSKASFGAQTPNGRQVSGVTINPTTNVIGPGFTAADIGSFASNQTQTSPSDIPAGTVIIGVTSGNATLSQATTNATAKTMVVGLGGQAGNTFTDGGVSIPGSTFTTNGVSGGKSSVGLYNTPQTATVSTNIGITTLNFGGAAVTPCNQTGFTAGGASQTSPPPLVQPYSNYHAAGFADLVTNGSPPQTAPAAFVNLPTVNGPVSNNMTENLGVGGTKSFNLNVTPGNNPGAPTPPSVASCAIVTPPGAGMTASISNTPTPCVATITSTGATPTVLSFTYNATDNSGASIGGPFTGNTATVQVTIGTPPVDQQINQVVNPGQLILSCNAPGSAGYPLLNCPVINLPAITLNGQAQTTSAPANTIYVSDNRGDPAGHWALTTYMVTTPSNPNTNCATATDFCNSSVGSAVSNPNGHIASSNLNISSIACAPAAGNLNPAPTAGAGGNYGPPAPAITLCTAATGVSGGTFTMNGNVQLTIPSSVYAGTYMGTVEYLVA